MDTPGRSYLSIASIERRRGPWLLYHGQMLVVKEFSSLSGHSQAETLGQVKRIEKKTFPQTEALDFDTEYKKKNTGILVAFDSETELDPKHVVGYMVYQRTKRLALLHKICVENQRRQQGIGKRLMNTLIAKMQASGCDCVQLWVDAERHAAQALYLSCGFVAAQTVNDYYGPGRNATRMLLQLVGN